GERASHTLQTTALIHEVYVRLVDVRSATVQDGAHFLALCARLMRNILVDFARSRRYLKRGGAASHVELEEALVVSAAADPDLVAVDEALVGLAAFDARKARVVELRFFGGPRVAEVAAAVEGTSAHVTPDGELA